jgi:hypothetical protein
MKMMKDEDLDENDEKILYYYKGGSRNSAKNGYNAQALVALIFTLSENQDYFMNSSRYIQKQVVKEMQDFINKYFYAEKSDIIKIHDNSLANSISPTIEKYKKTFNKMIEK